LVDKSIRSSASWMMRFCISLAMQLEVMHADSHTLDGRTTTKLAGDSRCISANAHIVLLDAQQCQRM
jgi:hypothetical protein